jgi:hypothetical protein
VIQVKALFTVPPVAAVVILLWSAGAALANPLPVLPPEFDGGIDSADVGGSEPAQSGGEVNPVDPPGTIEAATKTEFDINPAPDPPDPPPPRTPVEAVAWAVIKALFR